MNPVDNNQPTNTAPTPGGFNSADAPPPPMNTNPNPMPQTAEPMTPPPSNPTFTQPSQPPAFEQGTPTVTAGGGGSSKKIFIILGVVVLLIVLGIGAYILASNFLFAPQEPTPTSTPVAQEEEITALCLNIKAYDADWNRLSLSDLSSLEPGQTIRFSVSGDTSSGSFDKARFSVNSVTLGETAQIKPDTNEFYDEYVIPEDISSFNIEAQIHHVELDQWI